MAVVRALCSDAEKPQAAVVEASAQLLAQLSTTPEGVAALQSSASVRRMIKTMQSSSSYTDSSVAMASTAQLLFIVCTTDAVVEMVKTEGALDLLRTTVESTAQSDAVMAASVRAMKRIEGVEEEDDATQIARAMESAQVHMEVISSGSAATGGQGAGVGGCADAGVAVVVIEGDGGGLDGGGDKLARIRVLGGGKLQKHLSNPDL